MRKRMTTAAIALALCAACAGQASALEYTVDAPGDYLFGRATSVEIVYGAEESVNVDRSKNVSLIPPGFGTPTSYVPGSGEYLTPNLVPGGPSRTGTFYGGLVNAIGTGTAASSYTAAAYTAAAYTAADGTAANYTAAAYPVLDAETVDATDAASYPAGTVTQSYAGPDYSGDYADWYEGFAFTKVTGDLYYSGGHLGTLKIPSIGVSVKVYEGTDTNALAKGAGHFTDTSIWNGNVSIAGHNRGPHGIFGSIHTLKPGAEITLTTRLGTRTYAVERVEKISSTDSSDTAPTGDNCLTLYTCVQNQSEYRWCVRAVEV